jgi:hypothetical protein
MATLTEFESVGTTLKCSNLGLYTKLSRVVVTSPGVLRTSRGIRRESSEMTDPTSPYTTASGLLKQPYMRKPASSHGALLGSYEVAKIKESKTRH